MGMFGRSDDDDSVIGWSSDRDVDDVDIFKGPGALERAERSTFGGGDLNKFSRMAGTFGGMLSKAGGFKPYDEKTEAFKNLLRTPFGGDPISGKTTRLAGGLTMTTPPAFSPIITPGVAGPQGRSTGQRIAGAAGGALQGAATGSAFGPVGAVVGGGIGLLGGLL